MRKLLSNLNDTRRQRSPRHGISIHLSVSGTKASREDREHRRVGDSLDTLLASRLMIGGEIVMASRVEKGGERERESCGKRSMADVLGN